MTARPGSARSVDEALRADEAGRGEPVRGLPATAPA